MKNKVILSMAIFCVQWLTVSAQPAVLAWWDTFGGTHSDMIGDFGSYPRTSLSTAQNNGFVWVGWSNSENYAVPGNNGFEDAFLIKYNSSDEVGWTKNYGGTNGDMAVAIRQTADNGFIVIGTTYSDDGDVPANSEYCTVWVMDLGTAGNVQWQEIYSLPGTVNNVALSIAIVEGGYVMSGHCNDTDEDWYMKISTTGQLLWTTILPVDISGRSETIEATLDGGTIGIGHLGILKLDADGNTEWSTYTAPDGYINWLTSSITETPDGDFVYTRDNIIFKVNAQGEFLWSSQLPASETDRGPGHDFYLSCILHSDQGGFYACGNWAINLFGSVDGSESALIHFKDNGDFDWMLPIVLTNVALTSLIELENGNIVAGGTKLSQIGGYPDYSLNGIVVRFEGPTLATAPLAEADTEVCAGETIVINANAENGWFPPYEIELSDATGDFSSPTILITTSEEMNECMIPTDIPAGDGYRIRFVSLDTGQIGDDNGVDISVNVFLNPKFSESMGTVSGNITIAAHEAANGFHQDGFTMSGTGTVSNTQPSTGYENATGNANIFLGNTGSSTFIISGINTTDTDIEYLQFGLYQSSFFSIVEVAVSTNGTNYTPLNYTPFFTGWNLINATGNIPNTLNLYIRFTRLGAIAGDVRIDDVRLIQDPANVQIDASGPTAFCGPGSVTLIAPAASSYLWNNGATSQTINVSTSGDFSCTLGSANGCDLTVGPVHIQTTAINYYSDVDGDGYGDPLSESLLCAPDATHTITTGGDCDDENATMHEGATEICDGLDNNCDGTIDESPDTDHDGYTLCQGDCDDNNSAINPGMMESDNNVDDNCNGVIDESNLFLITYYLDQDGDLFGDPLHPVVDSTLPVGCVTNFLDCDDTDPEVYASAEEVCGDGKDNNCDGIVDNCTPPTCVGDLDGSGYVNVTDLLIFLGVYGSNCN